MKKETIKTILALIGLYGLYNLFFSKPVVTVTRLGATLEKDVDEKVNEVKEKLNLRDKGYSSSMSGNSGNYNAYRNSLYDAK